MYTNEKNVQCVLLITHENDSLYDNMKYFPSYQTYVELFCLLESGGGQCAAVLVSFSFLYRKKSDESKAKRPFD